MEQRAGSPTGKVCRAAAAALVFALIAHAHGQTSTQTPAKTQPGAGAYNWQWRTGLTCGSGFSRASALNKPTAECGALFGGPYVDFEAGVMGPQAVRTNVSPYLSANAVIPIGNVGNDFGAPLIVGGYTHMFNVGHALDYGVAFQHPINEDHSIQFEVRDYWAFEKPGQHNVVVRVVWIVGLPD